MQKHDVSYIRQNLRSQFSLSSRATKWVEDMYYKGNPTSQKSICWLGEHGGHPTPEAAAALEFILSTSPTNTTQELAFEEEWSGVGVHEWGRECANWADIECSAIFALCAPSIHAVAWKKFMGEVDEWWQEEGKYEEAIEESGGSKYFLAEVSRSEQFGERPPTARDFALSEGLL